MNINMTELFMTVLKMSLTASYVIAAVLVVRLLIRGLPKYYNYSLWAVVLFRLLSPVTFQTFASLIPRSTDPLPAMVINRVSAVAPIVTRPIAPAVTAATAVPLTMMDILAWVWLGGIALLAGYSVVSYLLLSRKVAGAACVGGNVYKTSAIDSPFVLGFIRPKIYLPPGISPDEHSYILLHEQIHIRRFDYLTKPVAFGALCLHWFNPLCWLAFVLFGRDMEMSCDEGVIRELGDDLRPAYSGSLLSMARRRGFINASPLAFGESGVGTRVKNVLKYVKPKFWVAAVTLFAVTLCACGLLSNPVSKEPQPAPPPSQPASQENSTPDPPAPTASTENGLTAEENAELKLQKEVFEATTPEQQAIALESGTIGCTKFEHLWWEESISVELIKFAEQKVDRSFKEWVNASEEREQCVSIYDLARDFYIPYYEMEEAIKAAGQEELYPLEQLKARFAYFGLPVTREEVAYLEQIGILATAGMSTYNWSSPDAIKPDDFMSYYQLTELWPPATVDRLPDNPEDGAYAVVDTNGVNTIYIGENTMYKAISKHFAIKEDQLRGAENYNSQLKAYVFTEWGFGAPLDSGITAIEKGSDNVVTVSYEDYSRAGDGAVWWTGKLKMRENANGVYEYLSSEISKVE